MDMVLNARNTVEVTILSAQHIPYEAIEVLGYAAGIVIFLLLVQKTM